MTCCPRFAVRTLCLFFIKKLRRQKWAFINWTVCGSTPSCGQSAPFFFLDEPCCSSIRRPPSNPTDCLQLSVVNKFSNDPCLETTCFSSRSHLSIRLVSSTTALFLLSRLLSFRAISLALTLCALAALLLGDPRVVALRCVLIIR